MSETRDFFISYTGVDKKWAEWIAWTLKQSRYTCILQAWDFVPGENFMHEMREALKNTKQVIAVLSDEYLKSDFAQSELNAALVNDPLGVKRSLIPVHIRECETDAMLQGRIHIDLAGKDETTAKRALLSGIDAAILGSWQNTDSEEDESSKPIRFPGEGGVIVQDLKIPSVEELKTVNVLYLGSDGGGGLDLTGQAGQIEEILSEPSVSKRFNFNSYFDVTTENIFKILNKHKPHIMHFSGKQNGGNVLIRTPSGAITTISDRALAGLLQNLGNEVVLTIIDTCKSSRCARSVTETVPFAMGVAGDIYDSDATLFYNVFYGALTSGLSISAACGQA
ncbi:MAG: toll/interleukin-1 receptor domain-containing protein, partial [Pyrinomonadaceae bacterium]